MEHPNFVYELLRQRGSYHLPEWVEDACIDYQRNPTEDLDQHIQESILVRAFKLELSSQED